MVRYIAPIFLVILMSFCVQAAELRQWTGSNGKVIEAEFLGLDGDIVKLKLKNGKESNVLISRFSKEDQEYVKKIGMTDDPFGDDVQQDVSEGEMLPFTDFRNKRMPDGEKFVYGEAQWAKASNQNDVFKIVCGLRKGGRPFAPWCSFRQFEVEEGKSYRFTIEAKSDKPAKFEYCLWEIEANKVPSAWTPIRLEPEWKEYTIYLVGQKNMTGMIAFNMFDEDRTYEFRKISLRPAKQGQSINKDDDPDKFVKPEKVRFTLEVTERGRGKFRIEKISDSAKSDFNGQPVNIPGFPKFNMKTRPDGISRIDWDCKSPFPSQLAANMSSRTELDLKEGNLILRPNPDVLPGKNGDGWCVFGMKPLMKLPMKISVDAVVTHRGECCNMEFIFSDCILTCHVYSKGEKFEDELEILCRIGDKPNSGNIGRTYQNVISANTSLEEPFESSFTASQLKNNAEEIFRGGIGRNLNRPDGVEIIRSPLAITRLSFEGRLNYPPKN